MKSYPQVKIYTDPGLLNSVNRYQGAAAQDGFKNLSRITENKYVFFAEYTTLKYVSQLIPETFFTPQYKLLGYSFSPPIFLGFIIPFFFGLYKLIQEKHVGKILFISTLLVIPSVLGNDIVSLNRLIIFSPVLVFVISSGLISLYEKRKNKTIKVFIILTTILVLFQLIVTLTDIKTRERTRFIRYVGNKYEIVEP